jgi:1-acyl-sn-glycerol-3-phosphate acyltransferase
MERVYAPVIALTKGVFRAQGLKFTIVGADNVPRTGGAVMAINHTSYFDFTYAGLAAQRIHRYVRFMAKKSIFEHRIAGPLMRGWGTSRSTGPMAPGPTGRHSPP